MDPKANLQNQIQLAKEILAIWDDSNNADEPLTDEQLIEVADRANELAESVLALNQWRKNGGFDPYL